MKATALAAILITTLVAVSASAAAVQQVWYLSDQPRSGMPGFLVMTKEHVATTTSPVTIPDGTCQNWAADETTDVAVTFEKTGWGGNIDANEDTADLGVNYKTQLGRHHPLAAPPTEFLHTGKAKFIENGGSEEVAVHSSDVAAGTFQIPFGQVLVFQFCNKLVSGANPGQDIEVQTDGSSWILSPPNSPNYPTPEFPVLPLTMAGLAIVGAVALRRRRD